MTNNTIIITIIAGVVVVAVVLFLVVRSRLTHVSVDLRRGRLDADMMRPAPLPEQGARQREINSDGNVLARDETGVGASQDSVKSGGDVSAIVTAPPVRYPRKKS